MCAKVFEQVRRDRPQVMDKVIPVAGDVTMPGLGLSKADLQLLIDNVSLVFNSAATVRFDEDLRTAVEMNVKGPQRLMEICHQMKRLDVSSCYQLASSSFSCITNGSLRLLLGSGPRVDSLQQFGQGEH